MVVCICQSQVSFVLHLVEESVPGKIDENNIVRPCHIHTHLRDQRFYQLACGLCSQYKLHICRRPLAPLRVDQPLGKGPRIGLGKLQRSEGSILIFIDTYNESQASAHARSLLSISLYASIDLNVLYDTLSFL